LEFISWNFPLEKSPHTTVPQVIWPQCERLTKAQHNLIRKALKDRAGLRKKPAIPYKTLSEMK
jgi:hypothetical protein